MTLATRCPTCGTVFRVVQDQLKISQGWVRCGRCAEVFNALETLFDTGDGAPPVDGEAGRVLDELAHHGAHGEATDNLPDRREADLVEERMFEPTDEALTASLTRPGALDALPPTSSPPFDAAVGEPAAVDAPDAAEEPAPPPPDDRPRSAPAAPLPPVIREASPGAAARVQAPSLIRPSGSAGTTGFAAALDAAAAHATGPAAAPAPLQPDSTIAPDGAQPGFVRQADAAARWRRPLVRAALVVLVLLLAAGAVVQAGIAQRDWLAAHQPWLRPWLEAVCQPLGLRIEPLRGIERIAVESSGLTRVEGAPLYRLSVVLKSRGETALRLPAIDLQITDSQGGLVSRRILAPAELGAHGDTLAAGQELSLQALLSAGDRRLAGYTVEIFYP